MSANPRSILAEIGNLLILAEIERQKNTSDSLAILVEGELSEASTDQPEVNRLVNNSTPHRKKQNGGAG